MGRLSFFSKPDKSPRADAVDGVYQTPLHPIEEQQFRSFLSQNADAAPGFASFNPDDKQSDYDMRGWWQAHTNPNHPLHEITKMQISDYDHMPHFDDHWKTPYHKTFSNQSQWAIPDKAPGWFDDGAGGWNLINPGGIVMAREPRMENQ